MPAAEIDLYGREVQYQGQPARLFLDVNSAGKYLVKLGENGRAYTLAPTDGLNRESAFQQLLFYQTALSKGRTLAFNESDLTAKLS